MSFQETWPTATVDDQNATGEPPEPGLYTVELTDAAAVTAKASGKDWVILEFRGLDGSAKDRTWKAFQGFGSPQQAGFTKRVCRDLGVDIDNVTALSQLDDQLKLQIGRYFTVEVKRSKSGDGREFLNTYIQGSVSPESFTLQQQGDFPITDANEVQQRLDEAQERLAATAGGQDDDAPPF